MARFSFCFCSILTDAKDRFLQIADDYAWLNPHLSMVIDWFGDRRTIEATDPGTSPSGVDPRNVRFRGGGT